MAAAGGGGGGGAAVPPVSADALPIIPDIADGSGVSPEEYGNTIQNVLMAMYNDDNQIGPTLSDKYAASPPTPGIDAVAADLTATRNNPDPIIAVNVTVAPPDPTDQRRIMGAFPSKPTSGGVKGIGNEVLARTLFERSTGKTNPRDIFEISEVEDQCNQVIGGPYNDEILANRQCYICGVGIYSAELQADPRFEETFPGRKEARGQKALVPECEHILPVAEAAQFLYLYDKRWDAFNTGQIPQVLYVKMMLEYAWAHHCCNMVKNNYLFVKLMPAGRTYQFEIDTDTITRVLTKIYTVGRSDSKTLPGILQGIYRGNIAAFLADRLRPESQLIIRLSKLVHYLNILINGQPIETINALRTILKHRLTLEAISNSISISLDPTQRATLWDYVYTNSYYENGGTVGFTFDDDFPLNQYTKFLETAVRTLDEATVRATEALFEDCKGGVCKVSNFTPAAHFTRSRSLGAGAPVPTGLPTTGYAMVASVMPAPTIGNYGSAVRYASGPAIASIPYTGRPPSGPVPPVYRGYGGQSRRRKRGLKKKRNTKRK